MIGGRSRAMLFVVACGLVATSAIAQRVTLKIAPPEGDTLRMLLDQRFDVQSGASMEVVSGEMRVWTHAVVMRRSRNHTDLLSVTDSVLVSPADVELAPLREAQRSLEGRTVRLRVDPNGGITVGNGGEPFGEGTVMPSMLPGHSVAVGESWTRDMRVPLSTTGSSTANVRTTFRFDSLTNHGGEAYISFHGAVYHDHSQDGRGATGTTSGKLEGSMEVDRRMSWITDSEMVVTVISDVHPVGRPPFHARMRITQSLTALVGN